MEYFSKYVKLADGGNIQNYNTKDAEDLQDFYSTLMGVPEAYREQGVEITEELVTGLKQDAENIIKSNMNLIKKAYSIYAQSKESRNYFKSKLAEKEGAQTMKDGGKFDYIARLAKGGKGCTGCVKKARKGTPLDATPLEGTRHRIGTSWNTNTYEIPEGTVESNITGTDTTTILRRPYSVVTLKATPNGRTVQLEREGMTTDKNPGPQIIDMMNRIASLFKYPAKK